MSKFDWIVLIPSLLMSLFLMWKDNRKPWISSDSFTATSTVETNKPLSLARTINKVTRNRTKSSGKYKPGCLGVSDVSRAILKDYGAILSRRQRKYYSKAYGVPFIAYRGC